MADPKKLADQSDDEPEDVSFSTSKKATTDKMNKIKQQIATIRETQKKRRIERQEKYIEQKKKRLDETDKATLPDDLQSEIDKIARQINEKRKLMRANAKNKKLIKSEKNRTLDIDLHKSATSDFIPLKSYKNSGINVVSLSNARKKTLIASESAKTFKAKMFNRRGISRQTSKERIAVLKKRHALKK